MLRLGIIGLSKEVREVAMAIEFRQTNSVGEAAEFISHQIKSRLTQGQTVLWLASGGSAVAVAVEAARRLADADLKHLTFSLVDERYGSPGHPDSNWTQLINNGFTLDNARLQPVLSDADTRQTLKQYTDFISSQLNQADYKIGLLGIGVDGHTAGILPNSPAVEADELVSYYETPDHKRLTMSPAGLAKLDEAVIYAQGKPKWKALDQLEQDLPPAYQPAQILKKIPRVTIFNDHKGEKL